MSQKIGSSGQKESVQESSMRAEKAIDVINAAAASDVYPANAATSDSTSSHAPEPSKQSPGQDVGDGENKTSDGGIGDGVTNGENRQGGKDDEEVGGGKEEANQNENPVEEKPKSHRGGKRYSSSHSVI